ncbi:MAG: short-chain dehydrogenase/reductase SDR [uncultured bacterium]|nr:MAG: short-chain dehydrogenase/reductase SDR [uncultured bacterium]HLD43940.1 SDR family NAD(P)-dependent oxidoreductase [bacterium]
MKNVKDKIVLITGAARGIGFCTAELFAKAGSVVLLTDIDARALSQAKIKLKRQHAKACIHSYVVDIAKPKSVANLRKNIIKKFGRLDILINNAGIGYTGELVETKMETWKKLIDVNFWGCLNMTYVFLPDMIKKLSGHIVNVSSGQAFFRLPTWGAYAAVKLAMACFSEVLHYEVKKFHIDVSTVYPFMVDTGFYDHVKPETFAAKLSMRLVPYYSMKPESVAEIIFEAVRKQHNVERVSFLNDIAYYGSVIPYFSDTISRISNYVLTKRRA